MDVPPASPPPTQGPFLEHIGPVHVREGEDGRAFGLRAEERHTTFAGRCRAGCSRPSPTSLSVARSNTTRTTTRTARR